MFSDIIELRDFYQNPLGQMARQALRTRIENMWPDMRGERVLTLGYGEPLLEMLAPKAAELYAFMPAAQGVSYWPAKGPNISCLVEINNLPLPDNSIDRVIVLHALEGVPDPTSMLREVWRVMKSGGRLLTIIPNRRGLWAHSDRTPFGNGQPYSASQIKNTLHNQGFLIESLRHALYTPPSLMRLNLSLSARIEKIAAALFPGFGGLLVLEASKQLYAPREAKEALRHRLVLPLSIPGSQPLPASRVAAEH